MNRTAPTSSTSMPSNSSPRRFQPYTDGPAEPSVRPRNRKHASQELLSRSASSSTRAVSPIPSKHPSRSATRSNGRPVGGLVPPPGDTGGERSPQGFGDLWDGGWAGSWTALQGLASSVLGGGEEGGSGGEGDGRRRKPDARRRKLPETWGPTGLGKRPEDAIGAGSAAERSAAVRALKMRGVLEGREEDLNGRRDTSGNYKRRTSVDDTLRDLRDDEGDALVYVHHVQPQDTLAGVVLRYNCQPAVFRKANRLWPNDSIQIRKIVVLPVDACTIKGRPCEAPQPSSQGVDLLAPAPEIDDQSSFNNGSTWPGSSSAPSLASAEPPETEDHPWTHVRWVLIDSSPSPKPVEIARMPRHTLGYFPPRRRKSHVTISTVSSPRNSSDFPQFSLPSNDPSGSPSSTASRRVSNLGSSLGGSSFTTTARPRGESVGEVAERLGWMRGPGGVGTFSKNVRKPGPAQDGLNSWAKKHIPGLAIDSLPSLALVGGSSAHFGFTEDASAMDEGHMCALRSGAGTPSGAGQGLGLENAASAIEGWVRRLATIRPGTPRVGGAAESSDLIELVDGAGSDDGRGFDLMPGAARIPAPGGGSSGREDLDGLARGRATAGAKGGKGD
jgi:hypothetical protein